MGKNFRDWVMRILFLCVANSARSQMAEGLANNLLGKEHKIYSAGSNPTKLNPYAVKAMADIDIDISKQKSENLDKYINKNIDLVINLCAEEVCPIMPAETKRLHWALEDPDSSDANIDSDEFHRRFARTRNILSGHIIGLSKNLY